MRFARALPLFVVVGCTTHASSAVTAQDGGAPDDAATDSGAQRLAVDACAPLADAGGACSGADPGVVLFPNASDALSADCRAFAAAEASGQVESDAATRPVITVPGDGSVVSVEHWITFEWSVGPAASQNDTYVVLFRQGCDEIARVVLQGTGWPVDPPTWTRMKAATGPITMTVARASGAAPSVSAPVSFTMGP